MKLEQTTLAMIKGAGASLHLGAQLYVCHRDQVICNEAFGWASASEAMSSDHLMLWMSAGKPVTAVAIGQLYDRGLLSLDDRVADYIPEFAVNGKESITVFHLLTHTAGFRGPLNNFTPGPWEQIIQRCCELKQEPGWAPGKKAGYHIGSSWFILGELVRRIDGRPIGQYVRDEIFFKIGQSSAWIGMSEAQRLSYGSRLAPMYDMTKPQPSLDLSSNTPDGILISRPGANARGPVAALGEMYRHLLQDDNLLLSPSTTLLFTARQRAGMFDETFKATIDWGLGFLIDSKQHNRHHVYGYGDVASPDTFGHSGNQCSCAFADPVHQLAVAWVCNGMPGEPAHQARQRTINTAIYHDLGLK